MKVWNDHKRQCYVSNAGFVLGKRLNIHPFKAATMLNLWLKQHPKYAELIEDSWVS